MTTGKESNAPGSSVKLIAEIGFNHGGDAELAKKMIEAAAKAGAHAVKFQSFLASDICLEASPHFSLIRSGEISEKDHAVFKSCADSCGVEFLSTPFSPAWALFLDRLGVPAFKVASMDLNYEALLKTIAATRKPVYLSTGMGDIQEILDAADLLKEGGSPEVIVMHCVSRYPTSASEAQLWRIPALMEETSCPVGFSDHSLGIIVPICAAALGACVIEKHFTLDKNMAGPDHRISADPEELRLLSAGLAEAGLAKGTPLAGAVRPDAEAKAPVRRGIHSTRELPAGHVIMAGDLRFVRPAAIPLEMLPNILGRKTRMPLPAGSPVSPDFLC